MENAKVLVAIKNDISMNKLTSILIENGYDVIDQVYDGSECLNKIRGLKPDVAVLDYYLPKINGLEISKIVSDDNICDIILMMNSSHKGSIDDNIMPSNLVAVTKPLKSDIFLNTLDLVIKNRKKVLKLENEIIELKKTIDTRKFVEKAKGLLIKHVGLTEEQAFRRIQKQSMDRGISMKEIAQAIILTYE